METMRAFQEANEEYEPKKKPMNCKSSYERRPKPTKSALGTPYSRDCGIPNDYGGACEGQ